MVDLRTIVKDEEWMREVFYRVANHFIERGEAPSISESGECLYRGPDGTRCAVGVLISDDVYDPEFEGTGLRSSGDIQRIVGATSDIRVNFLVHMQLAHDHAATDADQDGKDFRHLLTNELEVVRKVWNLGAF